MKTIIALAWLCLCFSTQSIAADHAHQHDEGETIQLTPQQRNQADITVATVSPTPSVQRLRVPGEVRQNGYTSYIVSPRIDSIVLKRHVALGEHVKKGQPLVSLFSGEVAEAQAQYIDSISEYQRLKNIGLGAVSDKQIKESQTAYRSAYARLSAYGLTEEKIRSLNADSTQLGEYALNAKTAGTVLSDEFNQGQRLMAGEEIMHIADEHELWVEARLPPGNKLELPVGTKATVLFYEREFSASVAQEAHTIDPLTRTRTVRLVVDNSAHQLHPGMFVEVIFSPSQKASIQLPETALVRQQNGQWAVFIERNEGHYQLQPVIREQNNGELIAVHGLENGAKVVMTGAFFIASQAAKSGFETHNH